MSLGGRLLNETMGESCQNNPSTFCRYVYGDEAGTTGKILFFFIIVLFGYLYFKDKGKPKSENPKIYSKQTEDILEKLKTKEKK